MFITVLDFYYAKRTGTSAQTGAATYGTPAKLAGSSQVDVAYDKSNTKVYESGAAIMNESHVAGAKVTLQSHTVSLANKKDLFFSLSASGGAYIEGTDGDTPAEVAIGFAALMDDGKYLCNWFYSAAAEPADESYKTSNESGPQIDPDSIVFNAVHRDTDGKLRRTAIVDDADDMADFFESVDVPT